MTTLEAKLRITAETAQASAAVKQLGKDAAAIPAGVAPAAAALGQLVKETGALPAGVEPGGKALDALSKKALENSKRIKDVIDSLAQLQPQITDVVTGLAAGQSPLTVLLQQLDGLGKVITPFRLLLGGVAAALGTVAFQAFAGAQESDALRKSLALTGNIAGTSAGQLDQLARSIAANGKATIGDTREVLAEVVASGQFTGLAIDGVARSVLALGKLNGQTATENLKQFNSLADGVSFGAAKLNREYNFLSTEQFKLIKNLEAQGRTQEAVALVTTQLASTLNERGTPAVGLFEKAWNGVKNALSGVLDDLKAIGRDKTAEEKIAAIQKRLAAAQQFGVGGGRRRTTNDAIVAGIRAELDAATSAAEREDAARVDAAAKKQKTQAEIEKLEKGYQDSLTAITAAGAQNRLAQELAKLEERKSAIERDHALGLVGERDYAAELNAIDVARLRAQREALQTQIKAESSKLVDGGNTPEQNAQKARVLQLEAQLIEMGARINAAVAKGSADAGAAQLAEQRAQAEAYREVWQRAAQQVAQFAQTAAETQARLQGDPARRAQAEADAATAALRRQQADTERDLVNQIDKSSDPNIANELQNQLIALRASAGAAIAEAGRAVQLRSLQASAAEALAQLSTQEQAVALRVQAGQLTEADGEQQTLTLRRQQLPLLERILALIDAIATTPEEKNQAGGLRNQVTALADLRSALDKTARSQAVSGLASALTDIATRAKTGKEALQDMVAGFAKAMLDVLHRKLAEQLVGQFIDAAGKKGGGGSLFSSIGSFIAGLFHSGGIAGGASPGSRAVNPLAFALAPRYHSGNTGDLMRRMGVKANERAVIVEDDEEILTSKNPRHVKNFRGGGAGALSISVGDVNVSGASGDEAALRDAGQGLREKIVATASAWVMDQHRPGGVFGRR